MIAELGEDTKCVATGGLANVLAAESKYITEVNELLTLDGLRILFERNRVARPRSRAH